MSDILTSYEIKFSTSGDYAMLNKITSVNDLMSQFIGDHYTLCEANRLLSGIKSVLNSNTSIYWTYTQSLQIAVLNNLITKIYEDIDAYESDNSINPDFSLPTSDFKIIVEAWVNFLSNSPLRMRQ